MAGGNIKIIITRGNIKAKIIGSNIKAVIASSAKIITNSNIIMIAICK